MIWKKSSRCESSSCVEVAAATAAVMVRDSKDPDGPVLRFGEQAWRAFLDGIKRGDFSA